ncbi:MAG: glycolate oxidase subunit GlcF [Alphaproteobacteria bacterium]|nr:glycolate oxidase subunit GlcF [Alphaproteobacteria bacterium]
MQTFFTPEQLENPKLAVADEILRKCVHCGFCTATCPTYVLLGDENDSPRGRIYLMKEMLEQGRPASAQDVLHIDRCLSCLSCMTTCPSGVNYMHLVDQAREHVEETYRRPLFERLMRNTLAFVMPRPRLFRLSLMAARVAKLLGPLTSGRVKAALDLAPATLPRPMAEGRPGTYPAHGPRKGRVALLQGCVQGVLAPEINAATIRLLNHLGYEVVVNGGEACCGSLTHHMGKEQDALARARRMIEGWSALDAEAIIITASGCGTTVKDYGFLFRGEPALAQQAAAVSAKACDISEFLARLQLPPGKGRGRVAYHAACSLQHGQQVKTLPQQLLRQAGYEVVEPQDAHLCCGSAGTYNILQPELSAQLRGRKSASLDVLGAAVIATGNIGCITQLQAATAAPVRHITELLAEAYL